MLLKKYPLTSKQVHEFGKKIMDSSFFVFQKAHGLLKKIMDSFFSVFGKGHGFGKNHQFKKFTPMNFFR